MEQPQGFTTSDSSLVCKLNKSLYGLKQAPRKWFKRMQYALTALQFKPSKCDPSLFTYCANGHSVYLFVYVDDITITTSSKSLMQLIISKLNSSYSLK